MHICPVTRLAEAACGEVAEQQRVRGVCHQELVVAKDVDLGDFIVVARLEHQPRARAQFLHNHLHAFTPLSIHHTTCLAGADVRELELALVARAAQTAVKQLRRAAQRSLVYISGD